MDCNEGYDSGMLTRKVLAALKIYRQSFWDHKMIMKVDDDAFVSWPQFGKFVGANGGLNVYMGIPVGEARVCRNSSYLWYEPYENWPEEMFPKGMAGGSGYILGRLLVNLILTTGLGEANVLYNEDRSTAVWIKKLEHSGTPVRWVEVPGIDGWWNWDYLHPVNNWQMWGDYSKHLVHHGLEGPTIACLADAARAQDPSRVISTCFETESGKKHAPLVCAQQSHDSEKEQRLLAAGAPAQTGFRPMQHQFGMQPAGPAQPQPPTTQQMQRMMLEERLQRMQRIQAEQQPVSYTQAALDYMRRTLQR
jgi:hypothetical protein